MKVCTDVKLNLGLNVLRKRPDGYHDLETLFVPYGGFSDVLEITEADSFGIEIENCGWDPSRDLTAQAYELLKADFPALPPVHIRLEKNAPVGAGLGGGSSDAASALKMMNILFGLGLDSAALASYASRLGSDCAFFIYDRPMFGSGRGELLEAFDIDLSGYEIRVEIPRGVAVSTREAYSGIVPHVPEMPLREVLRLPVEEWRGKLVNDFEASVFRAHPEIAELKRSMYERGAVYAAMSGSGSSVFGLFTCGG